jgi:hypothetical protein
MIFKVFYWHFKTYRYRYFSKNTYGTKNYYLTTVKLRNQSFYWWFLVSDSYPDPKPRIRIQIRQKFQILTDPDPQNWFLYWYATGNKHFRMTCLQCMLASLFSHSDRFESIWMGIQESI